MSLRVPPAVPGLFSHNQSVNLVIWILHYPSHFLLTISPTLSWQMSPVDGLVTVATRHHVTQMWTFVTAVLTPEEAEALGAALRQLS